MPASPLTQVAEGVISPAKIVSTVAGNLGHANGFPMVPPVGAGMVPELVSCHLSYAFSVAAYAAGGQVSVNLSGGGAVQSNAVEAADCVGASAGNSWLLQASGPTEGTPTVANAGLNLVAKTAFTNPGTAQGTLKYRCLYRVHEL